MKNNKKFLPIIFILILAAFLRFYKLGINPPGLTWDEAAWGYNAYSLGQTGRDEFGRFLPLNYLESFGDFKPPVYAYLSILPVKIFGLNEFSTRFASAFFGTLTIPLVYFLVKELFFNSQFENLSVRQTDLKIRNLAIIASFLMAISPWHIMLSRAAFEANVASFFLIAGVIFFLAGVRKKPCLLGLSAASFALTMQTFNTSRVVAPILVIFLVIAFRKNLWRVKKWSLFALLLGLVILLPVIPFFLTPQAKLRFKEVNIFTDSDVVVIANQEMVNDGNVFWSKILHNRRWGYLQSFLRHYFDHFNPDFLFFKGDGNPKFSTQDVGELYLWELPFLIGGMLLLIKKKPGYWWLIPIWLMVGIVPAATARETPHALRIETTLPTWQIITALGIIEFGNYLSKQKKYISYALHVACYMLPIISLIYFQHGYWRHYPAEFSGEWQYGYKPALEYIKSVENQYDEIWFTNSFGRPYIYFLFYLKKNPQEFWSETKISRDNFGFVKVEGFGKYHFFESKNALLTEKTLYVDLPQNVPKGANIVKSFNLLNGEEILKAYQ